MPFSAKASFLLAAVGSLCAALAHVWAIISGPTAYATLGAPSEIIESAEAGTLEAPIITLAIASIIFGWTLYALSAIGMLPRLLWLRTGLIAIAAILLLRAVVWIPVYLINDLTVTSFDIWSSTICFILGALYTYGLVFGWKSLRP